MVVEGAKVLAEALSAGAVESVYLDPAAGAEERDLAQRCLDSGARVFELEAGVAARVSGTVTPQPVLAVAADPSVPLTALGEADLRLVLVCADVRDPGNAGTLLRSAAAAGADAVIACDGSVDLLNPKTVRASAGAVFRVPVVNGGDPAEVLDSLGSFGLTRLGTAARGGTDYLEADWDEPVAVVLGNEARGVPAELGTRLEGTVTIPMAAGSESLNVGVAAAVICFEALRRRRVGSPGSARRGGREGGSRGAGGTLPGS